MDTESTTQRRSLLAPVLALAALAVLLVLLLTIWREPVLGLFANRERLQAWVHSLGAGGPLAIIGLQIVQIVVAPIPGQFVGLASGYLYGPWWGALYSMIGVILGNALALLIARRWGRPIVVRLVERDALARVDDLTQCLGLPVLLLIYIIPFLPGDSITLIAGLTAIPFQHIMLAVLVGRLPGICISAFLGSTATNLSAAQWVIIGVVVLVALAILYRCREALKRQAWALVDRAKRAREQDRRDSGDVE
jgi:uncharacterized membrane protein YdjX (TVP38/TMEM64 family)